MFNSESIMKKTILLVLLIIVAKQFSIAQITVTGTVTSSEDGLGMPGVAVVYKGTTIGTSTDIDGKYKIILPTEAKTLSYSFVVCMLKQFPEQCVVNFGLMPKQQ